MEKQKNRSKIVFWTFLVLKICSLLDPKKKKKAGYGCVYAHICKAKSKLGFGEREKERGICIYLIRLWRDVWASGKKCKMGSDFGLEAGQRSCSVIH